MSSKLVPTRLAAAALGAGLTATEAQMPPPAAPALDGIIGARGGIPLIEGGKLIGAIGCSGGTGSQDEVACKAGVGSITKQARRLYAASRT
jgi:uncharacterized protein GlcG (DUF336 family)